MCFAYTKISVCPECSRRGGPEIEKSSCPPQLECRFRDQHPRCLPSRDVVETKELCAACEVFEHAQTAFGPRVIASKAADITKPAAQIAELEGSIPIPGQGKSSIAELPGSPISSTTSPFVLSFCGPGWSGQGAIGSCTHKSHKALAEHNKNWFESFANVNNRSPGSSINTSDCDDMPALPQDIDDFEYSQAEEHKVHTLTCGSDCASAFAMPGSIWPDLLEAAKVKKPAPVDAKPEVIVSEPAVIDTGKGQGMPGAPTMPKADRLKAEALAAAKTQAFTSTNAASGIPGAPTMPKADRLKAEALAKAKAKAQAIPDTGAAPGVPGAPTMPKADRLKLEAQAQAEAEARARASTIAAPSMSSQVKTNATVPAISITPPLSDTASTTSTPQTSRSSRTSISSSLSPKADVFAPRSSPSKTIPHATPPAIVQARPTAASRPSRLNRAHSLSNATDCTPNSRIN